MDEPIKLNLGSHKKKIDGYQNVDIQNLPGVDVVHDLTAMPYPFRPESVTSIIMQEFLEHVEVRHALPILRECYRILKPGGQIHIQVPDIEAMCRMIDEQCQCVPRKAEKYEDYKADPKCWNCGGKAKIHPERWHVAFTGAQKHPYDLHRNHFTGSYLRALVERAGFTLVERAPNIYKIIINAEKPYGDQQSTRE